MEASKGKEVGTMRGKRPTYNQKKRIKKLGLNYENWLVVKDNASEFVLMHRFTGAIRKASAELAR